MSPHSYEIQHACEQLEKLGYFSMANLPYAKSYIEALKFKYPDVTLVHGVGDYNVGQYIYIPSARKTVLGLVKGQLRAAEASVRACQKAVETLTKAAAAVAA